MRPKFIPANRDQQLLFPPSIQDWLPEEHLANGKWMPFCSPAAREYMTAIWTEMQK